MTLGCLNYEDVFKALPHNGIKSHVLDGHTISWRGWLLPYIEQTALYEQLNKKGPNAGYTCGSSMNHSILRDKKVSFSTYWCPSSPLKKFHNNGGTGTGTWDIIDCLRAHYMGIGGSYIHHTKIEWTTGTKNKNIDSTGGCILHEAIELSKITDGTSNTMIIAEESNYHVKPDGTQETLGTDNYTLTFLMGQEWQGSSDQDPSQRDNCRPFGISFVRFQVNQHVDFTGYSNSWMNAPIRSAHSGGANVGFVDGSVRFLNSSVNLDEVLCRFADKDDGQVINFP
jgi:prepilin-type processing-associated H-X9-DG protein